MKPQLDGLTDLRPIRENSRFSTFQGKYLGEPAFVKVAADPSLEERLIKEVSGLQNMQELDAGQMHYRVPTVKYVGPNTLVTSWAEGELMRDRLTRDRQNELHAHLQTILDLFIFMDGRSSTSIDYVRQNRPGVKNRIDDILDKLKEIPYHDQIDPKLVEAVAEYARRALPEVEARFTHGDLTPGNLITSGPGTIPTVIDCESCSWLWPRHYNLVNFFFNYHTHDLPQLHPLLPDFFRLYFSALKLRPEQLLPQINFSAAMRSLQSIYEINSERKSGEPSRISEQVAQFISASMKRIQSGQLFLEI